MRERDFDRSVAFETISYRERGCEIVCVEPERGRERGRERGKCKGVTYFDMSVAFVDHRFVHLVGQNHEVVKFRQIRNSVCRYKGCEVWMCERDIS